MREVMRSASALFRSIAVGVALAGVLLGGCGPSGGGSSGGVAPPGVCAEHHVLEADCPFCHKDLVAKLGMCKEHGVPEALCWVCKPSLVAAYKAAGDWCGGHGVPESRCVKCHPALAAAPAAQGTADGDGISVVADPDAPRRRRAPSATCTTESKRVVLASAAIAASAGFRTEPIALRPVVETVTANAEIEFVQSAYARVAARVGGTLREVRHDLGDRVAAGDVLAVIDAPEIATAKSDIAQARSLAALWSRNLERERALLDRSLSTQREVIAAETSLAEADVALAAAKQRLRNLGVTVAEVERASAAGDTSSSVDVVAPFAGVVVARTAVTGEVVDTTRTLFDVADTSSVWANLSVPESGVSRVAVGQRAVVQFGGERGERVVGTVSWISPSVDTATRTVAVRVVMANPDGTLRPGAFGTAEIAVRRGDPQAAVPKAAVQWEGCCNVAFVKVSDVEFAPRKLLLGADLGEFYAVESGLAAGDVVVTEGSYLLRTEIRKDSIGAGCCDGD
ncbi:MAG: efflux RND transporter periplasmic adaptor subunit [Planctomycetes bacterium]|nr:efflux RND transporter periplasmic adaptor subunit [Planctomycetota bacterium]